SKIISRQDRPAVLTVARDITARRSMERLIATRLEHQRVLADLSGKLVDATVHTLDQVISKGIEQLGRILDADRAYIFSYASDAKSVSNTHEWCGAGIPSQRSHLQNIPVEEIISIDQRMKNKDEIWIEAVEDLPAGAQKDHLHKQGIAALAVVPQFHGEQLLGFLGVDVLEGRRKWTEEDVSLLRFFAGVISNAMERCRAEQELAESRQRYKHLFERMVDGFALHKMIYDDGKAVDYRFLEVNPAFESLLGKKAEEIVGRKVSEIMPEANPEWVEDYATVIRTGRPLRIVREQSGRSYEVYVYRAEKGQFATIVRDTTESRKTEQRLKENEERYQLAMRGTSDGMWDWDISTDHLYLSPRWKQMLGYRDDELENTFTTWQKLLSPEDKERCEQYVKEYLAGKQKGKFHLEFRLMHKNGVPVHVLSRALMVKNRNGKPVRMVGTHIDMTERKKQEQEIRKFKRVLDNANYGVGIIDRQGRLQYVNEYFAKIHGYSLAYVKGRRVADVFHAKDQKQMIEAVNARVLQEGGVSGIEVEHRRKDGSRFPMLMSFVLLKDKDGRPEGIAATALDISARKEMEEQLRDSNAFLEQVLDSISDPVFIKDQQHRWIMCNEAFASFVGKERGELIGKTDYDFFPEEEADVFWERDDAVFRTGRVDVAEERFTDQRGDIHWISTKKSCFELECGDKILTGIIRDLTERRNIENHQRRLTTAMNQASETIVVTDVSGAIVYVNPSFEATTGYAGKDVIGENPRILKSGEQGAAFYEEMWQIISSGETWKGEFVNRRKDGSLYVEEATITPIFDEKGQIMNYLAIKYDITDKKQAEQQMRRRLEYEEVIAGISGMLLGSIHADYPLREAISLVRRVSGANSAVLILNVGERDLCMHEEYRVQGEGCRIRPSKKDRKYADGFARWQHLLEAKDIITGSVSSFPEEERRILRR
ncbi:MAG: PAS domain S-box protein, partial [Nanoarchaeota archaeon]